MKTIYVCSKCRSAFGGDGAIRECPECKGTLYDTQMAVEIWRTKTDEEKETIKNDIINKFSNINYDMNVIMSSTPTLEGYKIVDYIDFISEDVIFDNSVIDKLSAGVSDFFNALSFSAKELTGTTKLIEEAKRYVMTKLKRKAIELGANAIVGVDLDAAIGSTTAKISINGTAVVVKRIGEI